MVLLVWLYVYENMGGGHYQSQKVIWCFFAYCHSSSFLCPFIHFCPQEIPCLVQLGFHCMNSDAHIPGYLGVFLAFEIFPFDALTFSLQIGRIWLRFRICDSYEYPLQRAYRLQLSQRRPEFVDAGESEWGLCKMGIWSPLFCFFFWKVTHESRLFEFAEYITRIPDPEASSGEGRYSGTGGFCRSG